MAYLKPKKRNWLKSKLGYRLTWLLFLAFFVMGGLWMAASATNQDLTSLLPRISPAKTQAAPSGYGFSTAALTNLSPADLNKQLDAMKATGATWLRLDLSWAVVQPDSPNRYDWSTYDHIVTAAEGHGFTVLPIVNFTPAWARPTGCTDSTMCGPAHPEQYAAFAKAAVQHYEPYGVRYWEIWNEPNISYRFHPVASPVLYTQMLKASYTAIKQADPNAFVIAASTAPSASDGASYTPSDFLSAMYANGAGGYFDAISAHPYTYPNTPANANPADAWGQLTTMHDIMAAHGDGPKQIWITEFGAPTNGPGRADDVHVTESVQAQTVTEAISIFRKYSWSGPFMWYDFKDLGSSTWTTENFYGLVRADGSHKPAYDAFVQAAATYK